MKVQTIITDITHDDLVNLFSTATYGSDYLYILIPKGNYKGTELEDENDCCEDKWAKVLLAGKEVWVYDYNAEDEDDFYGNLPHKWDDDSMRYTLTLEDIKQGLQRALSSDDREHPHDEVLHLINEDDCFDYCEADFVMQYIVFGKSIYG